MRLVIALIALAACRQVTVTARPSELARHRDELAARGFARVAVEQGGTHAVDAATRIGIAIPGNQRSYAWGLVKTGTPTRVLDVSIGELVARCDGRDPECLATRVPQEPLDLGRRRVTDGRLLAIGLFGLATTIAGITCLAACTDPGNAAYVGAALGVATFIYPLSTTF